MKQFIFALLALVVLTGNAHALTAAQRYLMVAQGPAGSPPDAPVVSSVNNSPAQITTTWGAVTGATSYNLYYRAGSAPTTSTYDGLIAGVVSPHTIFSGLAEGTTYYVGVVALNGSGTSALSNTMSAAAAAVIYNFETDEEGWSLAVDDAGPSGIAPVAEWSNVRGYGGSPGSIHLKGGAHWDEEIQEYFYDGDMYTPNGNMTLTAWATGTLKAKVWVVDGIIYMVTDTGSDYLNTATGTWQDLQVAVTVGDTIVIKSFAATDSEGYVGYVRIEP